MSYSPPFTPGDRRPNAARAGGVIETSVSMERAMRIADFYCTAPGYSRPNVRRVRTGPGSRSLLHFAKTGRIGRGLREYLSGPPENMPPNLRTLANYVRTH